LAEKLKKIRELKGFSMSELARISGVHQTTISSIETGRNNSPGLETIEKLSTALQVSPLYFFQDRTITALEIYENNLPSDVRDFLLQNDSIPYLMLSAEAFQTGVSSEDLRGIYNLLNEMQQKKIKTESN
ncbi:MAG: helix-turn-helix domain-containing protein, partial [Tannerella sp.]|jgi:transcriptional regulator with XRE-family HTH domain|nr:helix-turn-helix domain-containing protein [Tannerella sp.]